MIGGTGHIAEVPGEDQDPEVMRKDTDQDPRAMTKNGPGVVEIVQIQDLLAIQTPTDQSQTVIHAHHRLKKTSRMMNKKKEVFLQRKINQDHISEQIDTILTQ